MKKKFALSFVALASVALLAACGEVKSGASNAAGNSVDEKTIKIGFNFEETGAVAAYGTSEQKGAQLAVDEINAAGGIDGKQIEVVDKDNKTLSQNKQTNKNKKNTQIIRGCFSNN